MDAESRAEFGSAIRHVGLALALPGALVVLGVVVALGRLGVPFWPGVVSGVGLCCVGAGTLLNPEEVVDESAEVEFDHYAVATREKAVWTGRALLLAGLLVAGISLLR